MADLNMINQSLVTADKGQRYTQIQEIYNRSPAESMINPERSFTHRMYDISEIGVENNFTRNCKFKYTVGAHGNKVYKNKEAELKIEKYNSESQAEK